MKTNGTCYECSTNFYGVSCDIKCDDICSLNEQCVQDGFEFACGCEREQGNCNRCPKSTWGNYCENKCSNKCINSECSWIDGICTFGCLKGFYGSDCSSVCSLSCQSGCDQQTAECFPPYCVNCISGMSGCDNVTQKCKSGCITGFRGETCDKTCAEETAVSKCINCRHISTPIVTLTVCEECQSGYFYDMFSKKCKVCSTGCSSNVTSLSTCFPKTGICRFGCLSNWIGSKCDCTVANCDTCVYEQPQECARCQNGWFVDSGQCVECSTNCAVANECDTASGICTSGCKNGWYGLKCLHECMSGCLNRKCDVNGNCTEGCAGKRYGKNCDKMCNNCKIACDQQTGFCESGCIDDYHGDDCQQLCNDTCFGNQCDQSDGQCLDGCEQGYYGKFCHLTCGSNCSENKCDVETGTCIGNCSFGNYGEHCNIKCPSHCLEPLCVKENGACVSVCENGFFGSHCNVSCPDSCPTDQCQKDKGDCTADCFEGKFGDKCDQTCSNNCKRTLCHQKTGACVDGCKIGYHGTSCQSTCTGCGSLGCSQNTGKCEGM